VIHAELDDRVGVATVLTRLGSIAREQARYDESRALHLASLDIYRSLDDSNGVASCLDYLSLAAWLSGDFEGARKLASEALDRWSSRTRRQETAASMINLAAAEHYLGHKDAARMLEDALASICCRSCRRVVLPGSADIDLAQCRERSSTGGYCHLWVSLQVTERN
jgi:tetratricopeptide (TPR) repeat protein